MTHTLCQCVIVPIEAHMVGQAQGIWPTTETIFVRAAWDVILYYHSMHTVACSLNSRHQEPKNGHYYEQRGGHQHIPLRTPCVMEGNLEAQKIGQAMKNVMVKDLTGDHCRNRAFGLVEEGDYLGLRFQGSKAWSPCHNIEAGKTHMVQRRDSIAHARASITYPITVFDSGAFCTKTVQRSIS